jgi:hypothetical protein
MGLRNPGMRERHWNQLSAEIGQDVHPETDPDFTLQTAFDMELQKHGYVEYIFSSFENLYHCVHYTRL